MIRRHRIARFFKCGANAYAGLLLVDGHRAQEQFLPHRDDGAATPFVVFRGVSCGAVCWI